MNTISQRCYSVSENSISDEYNVDIVISMELWAYL